MKQLIQNLKTGDLTLEEVPIPSISDKFVLIQNKVSLISAGTERETVSTAKASLIKKAKKRPDLVKQVIANMKKEGLKATYKKVMTRLNSPKAMGYSSAGIVLASMDSENEFKPGDRVACAGLNYATHSEIICVPQNLVVKIPDNVSFEDAAYTTLGSIALQGVRQAEPNLGENVCVIGLGLLGQITCQLLKVNGCNVFGVDVSSEMVEMTNNLNTAFAINRNDSNILKAAENFTKGNGFDSVIITAQTTTNDPVLFAIETLKKKGIIVIVGSVKMEIPREDFYLKELELKISCSYGPGRYDFKYEELGYDYPYGYVRWTEKRNMDAFINLLGNKSLDLKSLTTHIFDIEKAIEAYDLILGKKDEPFIGILLKYGESKNTNNTLVHISKPKQEKINCGFIGAGNFAQSYLLPNLKSKVSFNTVVTKNGINAKNVATKFGFANASTSSGDIMNNSDIDTVFIATLHNTHAKYIIEGLKANKNIFVEKPLAITHDELEEIIEIYKKSKNAKLLVGFNRRFSTVAKAAKNEFQNIKEPFVMNYRINAGFISKDDWNQSEVGKGRVIGEVCHFIDLMQFLTDSQPERVYAECLNTGNNQTKNDDNILITVAFQDGSIGNITYIGNADSSLPKERFEIFGGNIAFVIDDFKVGYLHKGNKTIKVSNKGKGHKQELDSFIQSILDGKESPIDFMSMVYTTLATFKVHDSLATGLPQNIEL